MVAELNLDNEWSIGECSFEAITNLIEKLPSSDRILEFGSGRSTVRFGLRFPNSKIIAIESDRLVYAETKALAEQFNVKTNLTIEHRPLEFRQYGAGRILSYQESGFFGCDVLDCVVIDGPPSYTLRGREACLYQAYSKIRVGGIIVLDDYERKSEKTIVRNWLSVFPGSFAVSVIEVNNHLAVLHKLRDVQPDWNSPARVSDSKRISEIYANLKNALSHIRRDDWLRWIESSGSAKHHPDYYAHLFDEVCRAYGVPCGDSQAEAMTRSGGEGEEQELLLSKQIKYCLDQITGA